MDNNKILDNLNFIKIYFRVFIYKIIVAKETWIIQKIDKKFRIWLKTRLSARLSSSKPKKGIQNAPEHESAISTQEYHSALSKWRMAPFWALAQLSLGNDKTHHFRLFRRKTRPNSHSTHRCLFFKHSSLYK